MKTIMEALTTFILFYNCIPSFRQFRNKLELFLEPFWMQGEPDRETHQPEYIKTSNKSEILHTFFSNHFIFQTLEAIRNKY